MSECYIMPSDRIPEQVLQDDTDAVLQEIQTKGESLLLDAPDKISLHLIAEKLLGPPTYPEDRPEYRADYILAQGLVDEPEPLAHYVGLALHGNGLHVATLTYDDSEGLDKFPEDLGDGANQQEIIDERLASIDFFSLPLPELGVRFEGHESGLPPEEAQLLLTVMNHPDIRCVSAVERAQFASFTLTAPVVSLMLREEARREFILRKDAQLG